SKAQMVAYKLVRTNAHMKPMPMMSPGNANDVNTSVSKMALPVLRSRTMMYDASVDSRMPSVAPDTARNTLFRSARASSGSPSTVFQWFSVTMLSASRPGAMT